MLNCDYRSLFTLSILPTTIYCFIVRRETGNIFTPLISWWRPNRYRRPLTPLCIIRRIARSQQDFGHAIGSPALDDWPSRIQFMQGTPVRTARP